MRHQQPPSGRAIIIFFVIVAICFTLMQRYPLYDSNRSRSPVYDEPADVELWDIVP